LRTDDCNTSNNYVWIRHPSGEWSKYTHVEKDSARLFAGLTEGEAVFAGQVIGVQSDVGRANGKHVHFEVGIPYDVLDPIDGGGWLKGYNLAPRFCGVPGQVLAQGRTYVAAACD
jgi:murein DD-endopeptidase MepM/ murein hydrolase activator NlpD